MCCAGGCVGSSGNEEFNEIDKGWVKVSGALSSEWEENIGRKIMMFRIIRELGVVSNLGSLRVASFVARAGRGEDEITEDRAMGLIEKGDQNIWTFAEGCFWT